MNYILGDISSCIVFILTFLILLFNNESRKNPKIFLATWFVLLAVQSAAITDEFLFNLKGADGGDVVSFYTGALIFSGEAIVDPHLTMSPYSKFIGSVFKLMGISSFLGKELSVLAFVFSCITLLKIAKLLKIDHFSHLLILFYGLLPSGIIFKSIMLRESYQVLFFMLTVFWGLKFQMRPSMKAVGLFAISGLLMCQFHYALSVVFLGCGIIFIFWQIPELNVKTWPFFRLLRWGASGALIGLLFFSQTQSFQNMRLGVLSKLLQGNVIESIKNFRQSSLGVKSRATYSTESIDTSSLQSATMGIGKSVINYFFYPYPWKVENILDIYGIFEVLWRLFLLVFAVRTLLEWKPGGDSRFWMLAILYAYNSFLWAVGTTNYGTAIRHHHVGYWLLLLIALPSIARQFSVKSSPETDGRFLKLSTV